MLESDTSGPGWAIESARRLGPIELQWSSMKSGGCLSELCPVASMDSLVKGVDFPEAVEGAESEMKYSSYKPRQFDHKFV